eukprot:9162593-Pyramimonas_sp.AAC.1
MERRGYPCCRSMDLKAGWDLRTARERTRRWNVLETDRPEFVIMTPPCRGAPAARVPNWHRTSEHERQG